jgi:PTS system N-acetylglucosamine-specific IIC component
VITKWDLKTPGREDDKEDEEKIELANDDFTGMAKLVLEGLGGKDNIKELDYCATRLRLEINDYTQVDEKKIKQAGVAGVVRPLSQTFRLLLDLRFSSYTTSLRRCFDLKFS